MTLFRGLKLTSIGAAFGVGGVLALVAVGALASLVPAYRAASVSPVAALRGE